MLNQASKLLIKRNIPTSQDKVLIWEVLKFYIHGYFKDSCESWLTFKIYISIGY